MILQAIANLVQSGGCTPDRFPGATNPPVEYPAIETIPALIDAGTDAANAQNDGTPQDGASTDAPLVPGVDIDTWVAPATLALPKTASKVASIDCGQGTSGFWIADIHADTNGVVWGLCSSKTGEAGSFWRYQPGSSDTITTTPLPLRPTQIFTNPANAHQAFVAGQDMLMNRWGFSSVDDSGSVSPLLMPSLDAQGQPISYFSALAVTNQTVYGATSNLRDTPTWHFDPGSVSAWDVQKGGYAVFATSGLNPTGLGTYWGDAGHYVMVVNSGDTLPGDALTAANGSIDLINVDTGVISKWSDVAVGTGRHPITFTTSGAFYLGTYNGRVVRGEIAANDKGELIKKGQLDAMTLPNTNATDDAYATATVITLNGAEYLVATNFNTGNEYVYDISDVNNGAFGQLARTYSFASESSNGDAYGIAGVAGIPARDSGTPSTHGGILTAVGQDLYFAELTNAE